MFLTVDYGECFVGKGIFTVMDVLNPARHRQIKCKSQGTCRFIVDHIYLF